MLGYLLARAGVEVVVLEKHADFLRDFRGDTIHPSTLEVMHQLGVIERFLQLPHQRAYGFNVYTGQEPIEAINFSRLPVHYPFVALMPQWDFLNFLAEEAQKFSNFTLLMGTEATGLVKDGDRVIGVTAKSAGGADVTIEAPLTVAADGRTSVLRDDSGLPVKELGAPIDVLWFRIPRLETDSDQMGTNLRPGQIVVQLNRSTYWQCACVIPKGGFDQIKSEGLDAFRKRIVRATAFEDDRLQSITSWDDVKLLRVAVNRLDTWYKNGFLAIGDAAHAMSPVGGVGVNLAIQDAVAAANRLHRVLRTDEPVSLATLRTIQKRRMWPTRVIQAIQVRAHKDLIAEALSAKNDGEPFVPTPIRVVGRVPFLNRILARIVGLGVRMEHVGNDIVQV